MNIFSILSYLNKISLLAFIITAGFLFYQVYLLRKESSRKQGKPTIPDFNENTKIDVLNYTKLPADLTSSPVPIKKENKTLLIGVSALTVLTAVLFFIISMRSSQKPSPDNIAVNITLTPSATVKPTSKPTSSPAPTNKTSLSPTVKPTMTVTSSPTPTTLPEITPSPTEVILAVISPTKETSLSPTTTESTTISPTTIISLPTTGIVDRGLVIFAVASLLILFSFVF
ncbi:MAG: hypothetical protein V1803_01455 [Candidatus Roizmanbacteria bacterium]